MEHQTTADCATLRKQLSALAGQWRARPALSNDHAEGLRYHALLESLRTQCKVKGEIRAVGMPTNYQAVFTALGES